MRPSSTASSPTRRTSRSSTWVPSCPATASETSTAACARTSTARSTCWRRRGVRHACSLSTSWTRLALRARAVATVPEAQDLRLGCAGHPARVPHRGANYFRQGPAHSRHDKHEGPARRRRQPAVQDPRRRRRAVQEGGDVPRPDRQLGADRGQVQPRAADGARRRGAAAADAAEGDRQAGREAREGGYFATQAIGGTERQLGGASRVLYEAEGVEGGTGVQIG